MGRDGDGRKSSSQGGNSITKDKALFSSKSRMHKLQDRVVALRGEKITEKPWSSSCPHKGEPSRLVHSCPPKIAGSRHTQKVPRGVEDLVRYMSEVPAYLQLLDRGSSTNQEKALNMGVLDWGHLRKWTEGRSWSSKAPNLTTDSPSFRSSPSPGSSSSKQLFANFLYSTDIPQRSHQHHNTSSDGGSSCSSQEVNTSLSISTTECEIPSSSEIKDGHLHSQTPKLKATGKAEDILGKTRETTFHGLNWVSRSSSLTEIEVRSPAKRNALLDDVCTDSASATSRARRSPLRRMLDPLLKPRMSLRYPDSLASSPASFVRRLSFSDKPRPKGESEKHNFQASSSPNGRPSSSSRHERSKVQALLRIAWKNDSPLLTISTNDDDDILVATRKRAFSDSWDVGYAYTFHYVRENKKKHGWRNQASKTKKEQEVFSKVVGRMNVSESSGGISATRFSARKFVLTGAEMRPTASEAPKFLPESEIAAILIKSPRDVADVSSDLPHLKEHCDSGRNMDISFSSNIVAILPSGIHGLSETGSPSSLIKRWKSGGFCDCGGWDVGCSISLLTENVEATTTNRTELFIQGQSKKNSPIFSLVPFKEDIFTVDFDESISMLQAFSICAAILHRRKPSSSIARLHNHLQRQMFQGDVSLKNSEGTNGNASPASYGTYHPPLSPVGRA